MQLYGRHIQLLQPPVKLVRQLPTVHPIRLRCYWVYNMLLSKFAVSHKSVTTCDDRHDATRCASMKETGSRSANWWQRSPAL